MLALTRLLRHAAGGPKPPEDSLLILSGGAAGLAPAAELVEALTDGRYRLSVVLAALDRTTADVISRRHPRALVRIPRRPARIAVTGLRVRAVLIVGRAPPPSALAPYLAAARRRGVPVFSLEGAALQPLSPPARSLLREDSIDPVQILARSVGIEREQNRLLDAAAGWVQGRINRAHRFGPARKLATLAALRDRLGAPRTILCLGNGPTSASPALAGIAHDALFRVNHQWRSGGYMTGADLVFAGVKRGMRALGATPMAVATTHKERALIACRVLEPWHGPLTYALVEEIVPGLPPVRPGEQRPTTGAVMIATAVALAPARLVVAGIDMFRHPDGAYPEAPEAANAYTPSHDYDTDAAFIRHNLARFQGELVSLSPNFCAVVREIATPRPFTLTEMAGPGER